MEKRNKMNECYRCKYKESVPGNAHIKCNKPDPNMTGYKHGISNGWFYYPFLFDPVWKTKDCDNFTKKSMQEGTHEDQRHTDWLSS